MTLQMFLQTVVSSFPPMGRYALVTIGIVLVFRTAATNNFALGLIACVGTFATTWAALKWTSLPLWICMVIGMAVAFLLGLFMDVALIRKARAVTSAGKEMITMGVMLILFYISPLVFKDITIWNRPGKSFSNGILEFEFLGQKLNITVMGLLCVVIAVVLLSLVFLALKFTKWGLGVRATAANETVAQMMGINTRVITAFSWALSGALATISGVFTGANTALSVGLMGNAMVYGFLAFVLGGFTSFAAPMLGAVIIPLVYNFAGRPELFGTEAGMWQNAITFAVVLLLILIFPNGILGKKYVKKV